MVVSYYIDDVVRIDYKLKKAGVNVDYEIAKFTDQDYIAGVDQITDHVEVLNYIGFRTKA